MEGKARAGLYKVVAFASLLALCSLAVYLFRTGGGPVGDWIAARLPQEGYIEGQILSRKGRAGCGGEDLPRPGHRGDVPPR